MIAASSPRWWLVLSSALVVGCASVLGVEEAKCDPEFEAACRAKGANSSDSESSGSPTAPADETTSSPTSDAPDAAALAEQQEVACEAYCRDVIDACEDTLQFETMSGCMTICQNMYVFDDSQDGAQGNTLQCRAQAARTALDFSDGRESNCVAAGPVGQGCGTACTNYCEAMERFCPEDFEAFSDCEELCRDIPRIQPYTDNFPNSDSLECRVYHIQLSVRQSPQRLIHCGHAAGKPGPCEPQ